MTGPETIIFGIPVPSDNKLFLTIVVIHILLGIVCVVSGIVAMLGNKGGRIHVWAGKIYYWVLLLIFITVIPLSIVRWPHSNHLFVLGTLSFFTAYFGRQLALKPKMDFRFHTILMGASYIFLLTAFYVDNGKNLPILESVFTTFLLAFPFRYWCPNNCLCFIPASSE